MSITWSQGLGARGSNPGNLFLEDGWIEAFDRFRPAGDYTAYALSQEDTRLCFSLAKERIRKIPARVMRVLGDPLADQCWFGAGVNWDWPTAIAALSSGPDFDVAVLSELCLDAKTMNAIDAAANSVGLRTQWRLCGRAPVVPLTGAPMTPERYSSTLRRRLKRSRKKLNQAGVVTVRHMLPEPSELESILPALKRIEDGSWKGTAGSGIFCDDRFAFARDLSCRLARNGQLEIYLLELDGSPISYRYGFRYDNCFLDYNLAYLADYHHLSPGRILLDEIVRNSQTLGLAAVDASRGSLLRPHILGEWPGFSRDHYRLTVFAPTMRGRLLQAVETRLRPAYLDMRQRLKGARE